MSDHSSIPKRYTPPNQRKPSANLRKPGDRTNSHKKNDSEKNQPLATGIQREDNSQRKIITPNNCCEAYQLLGERWAAAMHQYNDPTVDLSERPIMYYGGSVWGKLPHQILAAASNTLPTKSISPTDYMTGVRRGLLIPKSSNSNY